MARSLFSSTAAPCLKCHATGDAAHDKNATAPNFLLAKERLKPDWVERWIIDPQAISPGTSMPSGLFRREGEHWVFSGPDPAVVPGLRPGPHASCWSITSSSSRRKSSGEWRHPWDTAGQRCNRSVARSNKLAWSLASQQAGGTH